MPLIILRCSELEEGNDAGQSPIDKNMNLLFCCGTVKATFYVMIGMEIVMVKWRKDNVVS